MMHTARRTLVVASLTVCSVAFVACASETEPALATPNVGSDSGVAADSPTAADTGVGDVSDDVYRASDAGPCMGNFVRDLAFGDNGIHYGQDTYGLRPIVIQEDDRIVAATGDAVVTRLLHDGTPDPSFGTTGEMSVDDDGSGIAVGAVANAGSGRTFVMRGRVAARLDATGQLDPTFGSGGATILTQVPVSVAAAVVRPTGELIVVGSYSPNGTGGVFVAQLTASGALDPSFANGAPAPQPLADSAFATSVVLQPDGKLVVGGARDAFPVEGGPPQRSLMFARYLTDGSLDPSFGTGGAVVVPRNGGPHLARMRLQSSGAIVFVIGADIGPTGFLIGRVTANGTLDTAFGTGGFTTIDFDGFGDHARDIIVLPNDKVLIGGSALPPGKVPESGYSLAFVRLDPDGALDPTFAEAGKLLVPIPNGPHDLESMAFQSTGALVVSSTKLVTVVPFKHEFFRLNCE